MLPKLSRRDVLNLTGLTSLASISPMTRGQKRSSPASTPDARRRELYALLGDLPDRKRPIGGKKRHEEQRDGYILETWDLDLNGIETVPAYLARPRTIAGRVPGVLFDHSHGGGYKIASKEGVTFNQRRTRRNSPISGTWRSASTRGSSASGATRPKPTCSRRCCGADRSCGE